LEKDIKQIKKYKKSVIGTLNNINNLLNNSKLKTDRSNVKTRSSTRNGIDSRNTISKSRTDTHLDQNTIDNSEN
jgi:hypothetical protein